MSETTNLKLFKHDNPETNTNKFDIEKSLHENWDKIDNYVGQVNNNISNINKELENFDRFTYKGIVTTYNDLANKTAIKGDIYKTNDTNKYYIYDGETWIEYELRINLESIEKDIETNKNNIEIISDCISNPVEVSGETIHIEDSSENLCEIEIEGNSKQKTREGKNFLELTEGTYTNSGVTATVKDGIITLNGTSTTLIIMNIALKSGITIPANTNYKLRAFNEKTTNELNRIRLIVTGGANPFDDCFMTSVNGSVEIGRTTEYIINALAIRIDNNQTFNNFIIKPQLELGNGTDTFEQGGIAPSPNYPSKVETIGNNINLYDGEYHDGKGYNTNTGTLETNTSLYCNKNYINILGGQRKITLSKDGVGKNTRFFFYNSNKQYISTATGEKNVEIPKNAIYLNFQVAKNTVNNDMSNIKIEQGEPTPYSKYGQGSVKITECNKNLAVIELGSIHTSSGQNANSDFFYRTNFINTFNNKSFSASYETNSNTKQIVIFEYDKYRNFLRYTFSNALKFTTTIGDNTKYIRARYATDGSSYTINNVMLNVGIETLYKEHKEQSYIIPVQEEMLEDDTFDWNNEEEIHTWEKMVLTGNENIQLMQTGTTNWFYRITGIANVNQDIYPICTHYIGNAIGITSVTEGIWITSAGELRIRYKTEDTVANFKQRLKTQYEAGIPVTIYYKLAQEKRIPFTQEQKEIASKVSRAKTYKPVTNIWTDGIGKLKVKYKRDPETVIESRV